MCRFEKVHPITVFAYYAAVLLISMLTINPILILISYFGSIAFAISVFGFVNSLKSLAYSIPMAVMMALVNPLFVHKGETILFFLNNNPITKEAILYGVFASLMLMSVFYWCKTFSEIMTSDKTLYLFGSIIPKAGMVLSMAIAFVPKFKRKFTEIDEAQKALGIYSGKSYVDKIRSKARVFSILITQCFESSIETADSMKARGYGLKKRTHYSMFRFTASDAVLLIFTLVFGVFAVTLICCGAAGFEYYPAMTEMTVGVRDIVLYSLFVFLVGMSVFTEVKEDLLWRYLKSKI